MSAVERLQEKQLNAFISMIRSILKIEARYCNVCIAISAVTLTFKQITNKCMWSSLSYKLLDVPLIVPSETRSIYSFLGKSEMLNLV